MGFAGTAGQVVWSVYMPDGHWRLGQCASPAEAAAELLAMEPVEPVVTPAPKGNPGSKSKRSEDMPLLPIGGAS